MRTRTVRAPRERVRISKRIVSEVRTVEVPVRVERLVVEHEPLDEAGAGPVGEDPAGLAPAEPLEIVLHEEVPVVSLRVQPVEVVRVGVRTVQGEEVVEVDLRSEQVVVEQEAVEQGERPAP
ncbi:YsnF/AvaK domain-containing protein [Paenibacillus sp. TRM 82003]|nr:YsnF/AvaK domain-containing protein [Kineococcus sp. TRM81007]MCI3927431.1 YsnF/AvaK domain-containing protein [Paenibacillus sp. TRM 82003]